MTHSEQVRNSTLDSMDRAAAFVREVSTALADGSITKAELPALRVKLDHLRLAIDDAHVALDSIAAGIAEREDMDAARGFEVGL